MQSNMVQNSPAVMGALQKNILERISLMAQEQIQLEFQQELQQAQQMQVMLQQNPQNPELIAQANMLTSKINARKAKLIAEMTKEYMDEEQKILSEFGGDPLIKLKSRELDIRARADEAKRAYDEGRISLDTLRAMQNQQQFDEKLQQNEELANLRADTSLEKQEMSIASKKFDFGRNFKKN
tara:strand:- start:240 stop:785 length:546 start_codon:yes stop_codon:yes gene_type:complete